RWIEDYGGEDRYTFILYRFTLERRSRLYHYAVLVPAILAALLTLAVFWLPPASERKLVLSGITLLVSQLVLHRATDAVTGSERTPKIATDESKAENDRRLRSFLLREKKYDTGVRPMSGPNETTQVRFSLGLLDVPVLVLLDPSFCAFEDLRADSVDLSPRSDSVALASPGGGVAYCPVHPVHAACKTDMTHFPFDRHECIVEFTNFIDTESNVNLTVGTNPVAPEGRSEFKVVSITTTR
ncbi:unnamed protein product, partial [Ixodes persulcatus]